jgi:ATP-dependent DNA helicase RecQ
VSAHGSRNGDTARLRRVAQQTFGWSQLRPEQLDAMRQVMAGRDVLVVLPTGAGKSAIYQVPALLLPGPTIVISPLIALQRDQVASLRESGAPPAVALNSAQRRAEAQRAQAAIISGDVEYVFLSPEQLARDEVVSALAGLEASFFVVDEAHCVSIWGSDFRPDYLRLRHVIEQLGHPTVLALTATAAPPIRADIVDRLGLHDPVEIVASFDRPNLNLEVARFQDDADKRGEVVRRVAGEAKPGLVYVATRKDAETYARELAEAGVRGVAYHAGMRAADRKRIQNQFMDDLTDVIVATSAFGMGIDKPNVRFVFHASIPASLDAYYQEIGRAGRDGDPAACVLFYRTEDLGLQKFLTTAHARPEDLSAVAGAVHDSGPLAAGALRRRLDLSDAKRKRAVNLLEQAGTLTTNADGLLCYATGQSVQEAVEAAVEIAENHQRLIRSRLDMMRGYADTAGCRRQFLLGYFGEQLDRPCGNCDTCRSGVTPTEQPAADAGPFALNSHVHHPDWGTGVVMNVAEDRLTVLFETTGYKTLSRQLVQDNDLLTAVPEG